MQTVTQKLRPPEVALLLGTRPGFSWLDGGLEHGREGRWSFLCCDPLETRRVAAGEGLPWRLMDALAKPEKPYEDSGGEPITGPPPPDRGGAGPTAEDLPRWIGYLSYDACDLPRGAAHGPGFARLPGLYLARYGALFAFDHQADQGFVVGDTPEAALDLQEKLRAKPDPLPGFEAGEAQVPCPAAHMEAVERVLRYIREGEIYQVNLARCWRASFAGAPLALWLRMREASPVPLGCFIAAGDHAVLACTMERFLRHRSRDGAVWTSPIKGTLARQGKDAAEALRLRGDPKECAEHAMVVDLMRNDLGRIAEIGSVEIEELMAIQPYRGLSHLVSTVRARLPPGTGPGTLLEATFPPGSVTGTPKHRALGVIAELEPEARGVYTGAVGFIDHRGGSSWAVAIRTAVVHDGQVRYFAGGGLVADSDPERETEETVLKARVFNDALKHNSPGKDGEP